MAEKKKGKKNKREAGQAVLAGLKAGHSYQRLYSLRGGMYQGVEKLIPIGPDYVAAQHSCEITGASDHTNTGVVDIDEELLGIIEGGGRWVQF